jgi:hypothetical protein
MEIIVAKKRQRQKPSELQLRGFLQSYVPKVQDLFWLVFVFISVKPVANVVSQYRTDNIR